MKIKYLPPSPNATVDFGYGEIGVNHVKNSDAGPLISAGFARHIPYRNYVERLAAEAPSQTAGSFQNVSVDEEWGIDTNLTQFRQVVIIRKRGAETLIYDGPTKDTPPSIVKQFHDATQLIVNPEWTEELRERERNKHTAQQSKERAMSAAIVYGRK